MLCMLAFARVGIFLLCTALHALAFQSNRLILGHPSQSTRRVAGILPVHAPHNCDLFTPRLKDNQFPNSHRLTCRVCRSIALRSFDDSKASALFASSTSNVSDIERKRNGLLARLRWLLFWPLRMLVLNPMKRLAEAVNPDGTVAVLEDTIANLEASSNTVAADATTASPAIAPENVAVQNVEDGTIHCIKREGATSVGDTTIATSEVLPVEKVNVDEPSISIADEKPVGERWAIAASNVDLSGDWEVIVTDEFKREYDVYLAKLGQPLLVRSVALGIIGQTTEVTEQKDRGRSFLIRGRNIRGIWVRTLVASGTDLGHDDFEPLHVPVMTADSEKVHAESWWEEEGTIHVSWLRGISKYGGGSFESRRYLEDNGDTYVCESTFYPNDKEKRPIALTWRFRRRIR